MDHMFTPFRRRRRDDEHAEVNRTLFGVVCSDVTFVARSAVPSKGSSSMRIVCRVRAPLGQADGLARSGEATPVTRNGRPSDSNTIVRSTG